MLGGLSKMIAQQIVKSTGGVFNASKIQDEVSPYVDQLRNEIGNVEESKELLDYTLRTVDGVVKHKPVSEMVDPSIDPDSSIVQAVEYYVDGPLAQMDYRNQFSFKDDVDAPAPVTEEDLGLYNYVSNRLSRSDSQGMLTEQGRDLVARRGVAAIKDSKDWNTLKENMPTFKTQAEQRAELPPSLQGDERQEAIDAFISDSEEKNVIFRGVSSTLSEAEYDLRFGMPDELGTHYGSLGQASYFALKGIADSFPAGQVKAVAELPTETNILTYADRELIDRFEIESERLKVVRPEDMNRLYNNIAKIKRRERLLEETTQDAATELELSANEANDVFMVLGAQTLRPSAIQPGYVKVKNPLEIGIEGGAWSPETMFYELFNEREAMSFGNTEFAINKILTSMALDLGEEVETLLKDPELRGIQKDFFKYYERIGAEDFIDIEIYKGDRNFVDSIKDEMEVAALNKRLMNWIEGYGYDSIRYKNAFEPSFPNESDYSYILFRPEQFKSVFARSFDPKDKRASAFLGGLLKRKRLSPEEAGYTIKEGDTLAKISQRSGVAIEDIQEFNSIEDPNKIRAGEFITLKKPVEQNQMLKNFVDYLNPFAGDKTADDYDTEVVKQLRIAAQNALRKGRRNIKYEDYSGENVKGQVGSKAQRDKDSTIRKILTGTMSPTEQAAWSVGGGQVVIENDNVYVTDTYDFSRIPKENVRDTYGQVRYIMGEAEAAGLPFSKFDSKIFIGKVGDFGLRARRAKGGRLEKKKMKCNKPKRTPNHPKKSHVVKACEDGKEKVIRFGQQGAKTAGKPKAGESAKMKAKRKSFKARHRRNIKKGKMSAAYWANRVKW